MAPSITVETSQFNNAAAKLRDIAAACSSLHTSMADTGWFPEGGWSTLAGGELGIAAADAALVVDSVQLVATFAAGLADHLEQAQQWYENADQAVIEAFAAVSDAVVSTIVVSTVQLAAIGATLAIPLLLTPQGMAVALATVGTGAALVQADVLPDGAELAGWWQENQHQLANPATVLLIRIGVSAGDEIVNGLVPGAQFTSPQQLAGATALVTAALSGLTIRTRSTTRQEPAGEVNSTADLAATIPNTDGAGSHATITEYVQPDGSTVYVVSVAGTSAATFGGENVMDNQSNLAAYAGLDAQSLAAVRDAMAEAGIEHGDQVVFAGYSQGALIVTQLAQSGDWDTQSVLLAGTPMHGNEIGSGVPVVQLEHDGDIITGLQGFTTGAQDNVAVVRRDPLAEGAATDLGILAPHALEEYQHTAAGYDAATDADAQAHREQALAPLQGAQAVTTTDFHFERVEREEPEVIR